MVSAATQRHRACAGGHAGVRVVLPILGAAVSNSLACQAPTPCHQQPVEVPAEAAEDLTIVHCPLCRAPWEVTFRAVGPGWMALWLLDGR